MTHYHLFAGVWRYGKPKKSLLSEQGAFSDRRSANRAAKHWIDSRVKARTLGNFTTVVKCEAKICKLGDRI